LESESVHRRRHVWFAYFLEGRDRIMCGLTAIGIRQETTGNGIKATGPSLHTRELAGPLLVMRVANIIKVIGKATGAESSTITTGTMIGTGIIETTIMIGISREGNGTQ
jgi:hypothetical protein